MRRALILDGYVDEPACFGVPPYVSPYVRYLFGVLSSEGFETAYITCDSWRNAPRPDLWEAAHLLVVIAGMTVPGRYRGGSPLTLRELEGLCALRRHGILFLGGPIHRGYTLRGGSAAVSLDAAGVDCLCTGDPEAVVAHYLRTGDFRPEATRTYAELRNWAVAGAALLPQHPFFPNVMVELELSRGCDRLDGHCSFCTEGLIRLYEERPIRDVVDEIGALTTAGAEAFRFGRCANILAYGGSATPGGIRPDRHALQALYQGAREACPNPLVLHTDNCNPRTLVTFPEASAEALAVIARHGTEGDGVSFGLECLDERVYALNNLKVREEEALLAVRLVNEAGAFRKRSRGFPSLLPGLNFISGLAGDDDRSFDANRRFLETLLAKGLMARRINIRQAMAFPEAPLSALLDEHPSKVRDRAFRRFKEWVRETVDPELLRRVAPVGTIVRRIIAEERAGHVLFGRPLGSYPPLVGVVADAPNPGNLLDAAVVDHGGRSLTAVPWPVDLDRCDDCTLQALPGIGKSRASRLRAARPLAGKDLSSALDDRRVADQLAVFLEPEG